MSTDPSETRNYMRFIAAFITIGTQTLLKLLYYMKPKHELENFILSKDTDLKRGLSKWQYDRLKKKIANNKDDFDISLLLALLSSLFKFECVIQGDLEHMRKIRNKIVAHSTKATMNEKDYDMLFERLDTIICRIVKVVDTAFVDSVATQIKKYKEMSPESSLVAEYMATLKEWHDELGKELLKYNHDLKMFFSHENEKYIRYIKLLSDAAPKVLKGILLHKLKCRRQTVKEFLMENQTFLMANLCNQDAVSQLFGTEEDGTTIAYPDITWDVCVIAEVLLIVFESNMLRREVTYIKRLKSAHETYSTTAIDALDKDKIERRWAQLITSLESLALDLSEDIEEEVNNLINKYWTYNCSDLELGDLLEKLKSRCHGIDSIADKYQETVQKLHTALEGLTTDEAMEFRKYEIDVKIHVCCDNCQKTLQVEQAIIGLFTNPDEDNEPTIPALLEIKRAINSIKGISVVGAVTESVVLTVRCESGQSLLQLINYINWTGFQDHLKNLEAELEDQFDDIFHVFGNLTLDTLTRWFDPHSGQLKKQFEGGVVLSLASTSQEGSNLKRHIDDDLNIELQRERKRVKELRRDIDKLQRENRDLRRIKKQNEEVIHETKKENTLLEGYLNEMKQLDQITQIELEDSQAENKNLLNQINEITKHGEAEKFDLKIPLEKSVKERERLENVRMARVLELKIQKSELEKRMLMKKGAVEIVRLKEMFQEHVRLDNEIYEKFQALTRRNSIEEIRNTMTIIVREHSNREQTLERSIEKLIVDVQKAERDNQMLLIEMERIAEEQERRRRSEQDFRNTIAGLESNVQTFERRIMTLETQLQEAESNQRQRAESDTERLLTLREEIATSRRELEQEKVNRRNDCQRLQNELKVREKSLREAEQENVRLRERQERTEQELERRQETIIELKEDINNARTERTRLEIQMADTERQFSEKITAMEKSHYAKIRSFVMFGKSLMQ